MKSLFGLIFLIAALGTGQADDSLNKYILATLENFRESMPTGIPALGLPPMDPLEVGDQAISHSDSKVQVDFKITNPTVVNLSKFKVNSLNTDLINLKLQISLGFPSIIATAVYDLKGKAFSILPIFGNGNARFTANDLKIDTTASISLIDHKFQLTSFQHDLSFSSINLNLENLVGGGALGDVINGLLNYFGPKLFEMKKADIQRALDQIIIKEINSKLRDFDISSLPIGQ